MKRIAFLLAFAAIGFAAAAQTLNVQSAAQNLRKGYLNKAKDEIDKACVHENTMNDAKTWYYAGLIYSQIGGEADNPKSKYKNLDNDWLVKAKDAALRCKELDADKEFAEGINSVFAFVGNEYYKQAVNAFNAQNWDECASLCELSVQMFNECGKKNFVSDSYLLAGKASMNAKDNEKIKKYFKPLVRTKTKENLVYKTLFNLYKSEGDTNEAMKLAQNYVKFCPDDYNANMLLAEAYLLKGNVEQGNTEIQNALEKTLDKPETHAGLLAAAGATLENVKDFAGAEAKYQESLKTLPNQFLANFGLGKMLFNRGVDKLDEANNIPPDDESGRYEQLNNECLDFFRQSIPYFNSAISFIDNLDAEQQGINRQNLFHCLGALKTVYARLEMYTELKEINARMDAMQKAAN